MIGKKTEGDVGEDEDTMKEIVIAITRKRKRTSRKCPFHEKTTSYEEYRRKRSWWRSNSGKHQSIQAIPRGSKPKQINGSVFPVKNQPTNNRTESIERIEENLLVNFAENQKNLESFLPHPETVNGTRAGMLQRVYPG